MLNNAWNILLKCTWVACFDTHNFQEGKIYEVKNGRLIDGHGRKSCNTYDNVYDINDSFYARFEEVKSEIPLALDGGQFTEVKE